MSLADVHATKLQNISSNRLLVQKNMQKLKLLRNKREMMVNQNKDIFELLDVDNDIFKIENSITDLQSCDENEYLLKAASVFNEFRHFDKGEFAIDASNDDGDMNRFVEQRVINNKGQMYSKYMHEIEGVPMSIQLIKEDMQCKICNHKMKLCTNESYMVCENCGEHVTNFEHSASGLTYEQELNTDTNTHFSYKRINHLRELLAQLQAKESSNVPDDVIQIIRSEFRKERIQNMDCITQEKVKKTLKKMGLNKFYEHARQITNILSGKPPPTISNQLYDKIINMFIEIQAPFEAVCPKSRKNFFSYNYILYKFCELLNQREHMELFPLLKSREKLYQQDRIWKDICDIKGWPFIKSV